MHVLLTGSLLCRGRSRREMLGRGQEGSKRVYGVPNILSDKFTKFRFQATVFMSFYRKSAGVLQDVQNFYRKFSNSYRMFYNRIFG